MDFSSNMRAGILRVTDVLNLQHPARLSDLANFFDMMEVWGTQIDVDIRNIRNASFISKQYSSGMSDDDVDDGVDSDADAARKVSRSKSKSSKKSSKAVQRSYLE